MIDQVKTLALNIEHSEKTLEEMEPKFAAAADAVHVLQARIAEERAKSVRAVADYRAGTIDMGVASLIEKAAVLDIADLEKLLAPAKATLTEVTAAHDAECDNLARLRDAFEKAETKVACEAFDAQIKEVERKLCAMLVERHRMAPRVRDSLWGTWEPSYDLKEACALFTIPRLR
jgi:hypothetical protein